MTGGEVMGRARAFYLFLLVILLAVYRSSEAADVRGSMSLDVRSFLERSLFQPSIAVESQYYWEDYEGNYSIQVTPFFRIDAQDQQRSHFDLREFYFRLAYTHWEIVVGVDKIFWGVTESQHLVDVINQTDRLEGVDGEDKLGQPMIRWSFIEPWGTVDAFLMPFFREQEFPSTDGGLSYQLLVEGRRLNAHWLAPVYEAEKEDRHIDLALRYSHTMDRWDIGVSYFRGTSRDPLLSVKHIDLVDSVAHWEQHYLLMNQVGIDVQSTFDAWIWKVELIERRWLADNYLAMNAGFEYTFYGVTGGGGDLGFLVEWNHDSRGLKAHNHLQNDAFIGVRYTKNDEQGTEVIAGGFLDLDDSNSYSFKMEASRRLGNSYRLGAELWIFHSTRSGDPLSIFDNEDFIELSLTKYF